MENRINIATLLKHCPTGMELDCVMYEDCRFLDVDTKGNSYLIRITTPCGIKYLDKYGCYTTDNKAKCIIFPKGKTTWEGFYRPFKDGDILFYNHKSNNVKYAFIYKRRIDMHYLLQYCGWFSEKPHLSEQFNMKERIPLYENDDIRLATEEEKEKLFDAIKENGYRWNAETKTLEKVEPKFKAGDRIRHKEETKWTCLIKRIDDKYWVYGHPTCYTIPFGEQDEYELVPNKFDINTLKPLQPVLVRNTNGQVWTMNFFSHIIDTNKGLQPSIVCVTHSPNQCIPYKGNEFLRGTSDECKDFYKTWE